MILLRLLEHDLHRARKHADAHPMWIETPAKPEFLPAVVSLSTPRFAASRKLVEGRIRSGVFGYDPDRLDEVIPDLLQAAYDLSEAEGFPNRFADAASAFAHVQRQSGTKAQPHAVLVPSSWTDAALKKWAGDSLSGSSAVGKDGSTSLVFNKTCRVFRSAFELPVFFSRPDFVGLYTQFVGGRTSIVLHNVRNGLAFCKPASKNVRRRPA